MKTLARKHYTQVDGLIKEPNIYRTRTMALDKLCLEIGANKGKETIVLAQVAKKVLCLTSSVQLEECKSNLEGYDNVTFSTDSFKSLQDRHFDFIYITSIDSLDPLLYNKLKEGGLLEYGVQS